MSAIQYLLAGDLVHIKKFAKDANGRIEYIGYSFPGVAESDPRWFIKKLIYDAGGFQTDELFANGKATFESVWSLKGSYTYS